MDQSLRRLHFANQIETAFGRGYDLPPARWRALESDWVGTGRLRSRACSYYLYA